MFRDAVKTAKIDQKVGLKPSTIEILTVEQQIFMKDIITVCMGQDDKKRHEALYTLETDAGLQVEIWEIRKIREILTQKPRNLFENATCRPKIQISRQPYAANALQFEFVIRAQLQHAISRKLEFFG